MGVNVEFKFDIGDFVLLQITKTYRISVTVDACTWSGPSTKLYQVHWLDKMERLQVCSCLESELEREGD